MPSSSEIISPPVAAAQKVTGEMVAALLSPDDDGVARRDFGERYEFKRVLGEGGQGIVVGARDKLLEREVAIKVLKKRADPAHIAMLNREAIVGATLEHPNILPTYDLGKDEVDSPLLVMRETEGKSLEELLKKLYSENDGLRRERWRLLNIFTGVLHAIAFAHAKGVLHLDLKPANVSLGAHGEVYVIDWGFARRVGEAGRRSGGTVHYVAPERMAGNPFDERADIFSLGVLLYRLLTGHHPRELGGRLSFKEYRQKWRQFPVVPARRRDPTIAPELAAIAHQAMAEAPSDRYRSTGEMLIDLENFLALLPVSAYREGLWGRLKRGYRKHKRYVLAAVAIGLSAAVAGYALREKNVAERHQRQVEQEKRDLENRERLAAIARNEATRARYEARALLKRANDQWQKAKGAVENAAAPADKQALLAPFFALLAKAEKIDPAYAEIFDLRAQARKLAFDWTGALADYERAYQLDSSYLLALYEAGMLLADVFEQPEKAREKFRLMKTVSPDDEYAELGQAQVDLHAADLWLKLPPAHRDYAQRKELASDLYDGVLTRLDAIEQVNPALSDVWYLRGLAYQKSPRRRSAVKALAAYDRYLAARRDNPSAWLNRGDARKDLGNIDGAIADYTAALTVKPDFLWALRNRGYLLYKEKNQPERALADLNLAIALAPQLAWSYMDRGAVYEGVGDYEKADADYERARTLEPENPRILYRFGVLRFYQTQFAAAEKFFGAALNYAGDADDAPTYYRRGLARLALGNYADAISDFEQTLDRYRQNDATPNEMIYPALMRFLAFKLWGQPLDKNDFGAQLKAPNDKPWLTAAGSYYLGEATAGDVLTLAGDPFAGGSANVYRGAPAQKALLLTAANLRAVCEARFYLGAYNLAVGDRTSAAEHLQAGADTGMRSYFEHVLCDYFLRKLREEK
jgi:serine/threonine-protein kinase